MKRFLSIVILTLFCLGGCVTAEELRRDMRKETALCLVESFGWEPEDEREIVQMEMGKRAFYGQYVWSLGQDPYRMQPGADQGISGGNLPGIYPEFFAQGYAGLEDMPQDIVRFRIPLAYEMPEKTRLEAWIAFYEGTLCETSIHAVQYNANSGEENAGFVDLGTICPLNGGESRVEAWKNTFITDAE